MKSTTLDYTLSLLMITVSVYLLLEHPTSGKYLLMAGFLIFSGIVLNIYSFFKK